jgi:PAS domain S-box-containing protein
VRSSFAQFIPPLGNPYLDSWSWGPILGDHSTTITACSFNSSVASLPHQWPQLCCSRKKLDADNGQLNSKQLDLRTKEKMESETKFTRMAEFAPVGMFIASSTGQITYSNDTWWEISRHPRSFNSANTWMDSIMDEDRPRVEKVWHTLVDSKTAVTHEFRFKTPWQDPNGNMTENGGLKSVFGSITNISSQKSAEDFQKRRMEEAMELKRQQENFIDMTSCVYRLLDDAFYTDHQQA